MSERNVAAILKAAEYLKSHGVTVEFESGWETRAGATVKQADGTRVPRDTTPQVIYWHHTGGDYTSVSYLRDGDKARGLGTLSNFAVRQNGNVVVIAAKYANTQGYGDKAAHDRIANDAPLDRKVKPGPDGKWSANGWGFGIEVIDRGDAFSAEAYRSTILLSVGLVDALGLNREKPPVGGHKEFTGRKVDPWHDMAQVRREVRDLLGESREVNIPDTVPVPAAPLVAKTPNYSNPHTPLGVDGIWGERTSLALQHALKEKYNAWGWDGKPLVVDGVFGRNSWRALQRVMNQQIGAGLSEDGIEGPATRKALQRFVGVRADGIVGRGTIRALQSHLNNNTL